MPVRVCLWVIDEAQPLSTESAVPWHHDREGMAHCMFGVLRLIGDSRVPGFPWNLFGDLEVRSRDDHHSTLHK